MSVGQPVHDCAQVERDCIELHAALAEAIRRLRRAKGEMAALIYDPFGFPELNVTDLCQVLDRTSQPTPAARKAAHEPPPGDWAL